MSGLLENMCIALTQVQREKQKNEPCNLTDEEIITLWNKPFGSCELPMSDEFLARSTDLMNKGLIKGFKGE